MKVQVNDATPIQLNYLMATVEFDKPAIHSGVVHAAEHYMPFSPATDWAQGGPIIEREEIGIQRRMPCMRGEKWEASGSVGAKGAGYSHAYGPTPLIAAMRCFVASKLGDEVDVPEELK